MSSVQPLAGSHTQLSESAAGRAGPCRQPDGFVVVSWWQHKSGDGRGGNYEYEPRPTLNDALDTYREYEDGEYDRARAIGIFAVRNGLPIGGRLESVDLMRMMQEARRGGS